MSATNVPTPHIDAAEGLVIGLPYSPLDEEDPRYSFCPICGASCLFIGDDDRIYIDG